MKKTYIKPTISIFPAEMSMPITASYDTNGNGISEYGGGQTGNDDRKSNQVTTVDDDDFDAMGSKGNGNLWSDGLW